MKTTPAICDVEIWCGREMRSKPTKPVEPLGMRASMLPRKNTMLTWYFLTTAQQERRTRTPSHGVTVDIKVSPKG